MADGILCFLSAVDPSYIANPDFPQPPNFPPSLIYPPVGPFSHQQSVVIPESSGSVAMDRLPSLPVAPASEPHFIVYVGNIASTVDNDFFFLFFRSVDL